MVSRKIFFLIPLILLSALILFAAGFFLFFTLAEYRPANLETARIDRGAKRTEIKTESSFKILIWNIGYCGLDAQNDFFYDGGTGVTARSKEAVLQNAETVKKNIAEENCEFNLLQETDIKSKRSFYINEKEIMENLFTDDDSSFAVNYNAVTVPYPVLNPLGKVHSGIFTASKFKMQSALRRQLPGSFSWPLKTVNLKRCLLVSEFETEIPGKNLYIINLHLSAYDSDGSMRRQEMAYLKDLAENLYAAGHWVIAGGDWNSIFSRRGKRFVYPIHDRRRISFLDSIYAGGLYWKRLAVGLRQKPTHRQNLGKTVQAGRKLYDDHRRFFGFSECRNFKRTRKKSAL